MSPDSTSSSVQRSTGCIHRDQTRLDYSPAAKLSTNKGNGTLPHRSLWKVALKEKKISLKIFNKCKFIWSIDKEKWRAFFLGLHSIWQQFGSIVCFGPGVWSMIDDRGENHEPLARAQTCKLLSADCWILLDIYQADYSMCLYTQTGSSWSAPPQEGELGAEGFPPPGESAQRDLMFPQTNLL